MNAGRNEDRISALVERYFLDALSDVERQELVAALEQNQSHRSRFRRAARLDAELRYLSSSEEDEHDSPANVPSLAVGVSKQPAPLSWGADLRANGSRLPWGLAAAAVVALIAAVTILLPQEPTEVVRISHLSGSLQWTGDGGRVSQDLQVGTALPGGTLEGLSPATWVEMKFRDGSTVTLLGKSLLTFSDRGQKVLHLSEGQLSAEVAPQSDGTPMLIHTRTGTLEILGTQLNVEAELSSTFLNVSQGLVRVKRMNDGSTVDVPARHQAISEADSMLAATAIPSPVSHWHSQLQSGPDDVYLGKWLPADVQRPARVKAVPIMFSPVARAPETLYLVSLAISHGERTPVALEAGSRFRIRGRIDDACDVHFGLNAHEPTGGFANKFHLVRRVEAMEGLGQFEIELPIRQFRPLGSQPSSPAELIVGRFWCHTVNRSAGLQISHVELLPLAL